MLRMFEDLNFLNKSFYNIKIVLQTLCKYYALKET